MLASNVASSALTSVTPLNCMLLTIIAIAKIVTCIFFAIFVKILYAIRTIIAKSRKLQGFLYTDSLHGAHFLTAEAGDTASLFKSGLPFFDTDDMSGTALRTFSASHAFLRGQLRIGFQQSGRHEHERLA